MALVVISCGSKGGGTAADANGDGDGDGSIGPDADTTIYVDAPPFGGSCTPNTSAPQCSNCMDDDGDGRTDGDDIECTGAFDNDESSFKTDIPGDNIDSVMQDCFFDGNSGAGNDGCNVHVCCLLGAETVAECPIGANRYKPNDCPPPIGTKVPSDKCQTVCGNLTPPGCDCFGCCTVYFNGAPYDILTNPNVSPACDETNINDPTKCKTCTKVDSCGTTECGGTTCVLCPGQDPGTLDPSCNMTPTCPEGTTPCGAQDECGAQTYCSSGCCIGVIM
ncbi:MAG: hypothetical protein AB7P03_23585 [Kofleriaceae bacterium]